MRTTREVDRWNVRQVLDDPEVHTVLEQVLADAVVKLLDDAERAEADADRLAHELRECPGSPMRRAALAAHDEAVAQR